MVLTSCARAVAEHMTNSREGFDHEDRNKLFNTLIVVAFWLVVTLLFGTWLWNQVACKVVTVLKPLNSIWQLLGLAILADMLIPHCCF